MFKRSKPVTPPDNKPDDERELEEEAREVISESRDQIDRARNLLAKEVRRLDEVLSRG